MHKHWFHCVKFVPNRINVWMTYPIIICWRWFEQRGFKTDLTLPSWIANLSFDELIICCCRYGPYFLNIIFASYPSVRTIGVDMTIFLQFGWNLFMVFLTYTNSLHMKSSILYGLSLASVSTWNIADFNSFTSKEFCFSQSS